MAKTWSFVVKDEKLFEWLNNRDYKKNKCSFAGITNIINIDGAYIETRFSWECK